MVRQAIEYLQKELEILEEEAIQNIFESIPTNEEKARRLKQIALQFQEKKTTKAQLKTLKNLYSRLNELHDLFTYNRKYHPLLGFK
jgi:ribosome-binding ATPase YchF (GTP1/OBG family)